MAFFNEFPHTRSYDADLGWIIKKMGELLTEYGTIDEWKTTHEKEYAELKDAVDGLINNLVDVITPWDSSIAYHIFSVVEYQGTNYIAVQDVPIGTMITNTDYWQPAQTAIEQINAMSIIVSNLNEWKALQPVTPQDFGAVADGVTNDVAAINAALETNRPVYFPPGNYYIGDDSIQIFGLFNTVVDMSSATITYEGLDYAIDISYMDCVDFKIGYLFASRGGGVHLHSDAANNHLQYNNFYFHKIQVLTDCFLVEPSGSGWINEIRYHDGQLAGGEYGFRIINTSQYTCNQHAFFNIGVEGVTTGFKFDGTTNLIGEILVVGLRMHESFTRIYETLGSVHTLHHISAHELNLNWVSIDPNGQNPRWRFDCPVIDAETGLRHFGAYTDAAAGRIYYDDNVHMPLTSKQEIGASTNLNDIIIEGKYFIPIASVSSLVNAPAGLKSTVAYILTDETCYNHAYHVQTISSYNDTQKWVRYSNADASSWTDWHFMPSLRMFEDRTIQVSLTANGNGNYTFEAGKTAYLVQSLYAYANYQYKIVPHLEPSGRGVTFIGNNTSAVTVELKIRIWFYQ